MIYDFDEVIDRRSTDSVKWQIYGDNVLPLWVADMDFVSPEPVVRALQQRVNHRVFGYPADSAELKQVVAERMEMRYGWKVSPEALVLTPGVVTGFNLAAHAFASPGGVLVQTPVYPPFLSMAASTGTTRQEMELTREADGSYSIDFDQFEAAITDETKMFLLCNPHNPVGRVFRKDELERMAEICLRHNLVICSDEIHSDLTYAGHRHTPIASLSKEIEDRSITLIAPSKTFNIAGLECSVAIIPNPELRKQYTSARKGLVGGVNVLGLTAGLAAYQEGQDWLDQLLAYLEKNRNYLVKHVPEMLPGVKIGVPEGTYLAWLDCREANISGSPYEFFLHQARVALNDGTGFGRGGQGFLRMNFGSPRALLEEALERMRHALTGEKR